MAEKDVRLVIRARNEASKAIESVADTLKKLNEQQKSTGQSAKQMEGMLGQLASEFQRLTKEAAGLNALTKVSSELDKAAQAVKRLEEATRTSAQDFAKLARSAQQAAAETNKLRGQSDGLARAMDTQKTAIAAARTEQTRANAELRKAEQLQRRVATAAARHVSTGSFTNAARSAQVFAAAEVNAARAAADSAATAYNRLKTEQDQLAASRSNLTERIRAAASHEAKLRSETEKLATATKANKTALDQSRAGLQQIQGIAQGAAASLGKVGASQAELAARSKETAAALKQTQSVMAAMQRYSTGGGAFTDPKAAAAIRAQREEMERALQTWKTLEAQARTLGQEIGRTAAPTERQRAALQQVVSAARAAKAEYTQLQGAMARLQGSAQGTFAALDRVDGGLKRVAQSARQAAAAKDQAAAASGRFAGAFRRIYGESRQAMSMMQRVRGEVLGLTMAYLGLHNAIRQIGGVITAFQKLEAAQNRLGVVFEGNRAATANELGWLERQAARLGIEFGTLGDQYSKFAVAARQANFESESTRRIFLSVAEAGRVNKLSMEQMSGIFLALEQMISKGKVTSEELRRQLGDRLPGAFNIMARALGLTTAELDDMMRKGQILSNEETMLKFAKEMERVFGPQLNESLKSTTTLIGQFTNELFQAQLRVGEGGFIDALNESLRTMTEYFRSREGRDFFLSIGAALGTLTNGLTFVLQNFGYLQNVLQLIVGIKIIQFLAALVGGFVNLNGSVKAGTTALAVYRTALVATGSQMAALGAAAKVVGVALRSFLPQLAIAGAGYALMEVITRWMGGVSDATRNLDEHKRIMLEVMSAYDAAKDKSSDWAKNIQNVTLDQANANVRNMASEWDKARDAVKNYSASIGDSIKITFTKERNELINLREEFKKGAISLAEYREKLDDIYTNTDNDTIRRYAEGLLEVIRAAEKTEYEVGQAAAAAKDMGSTMDLVDGIISQTGKTTADYAEAQKNVAEALQESAEAAEEYQKALQGIQEMIPSVEKEMKRMKEQSKLDSFVKSIRDGGGLLLSENQNLIQQAQYSLDMKFTDTTPLVNSMDTNSQALREHAERIKDIRDWMSTEGTSVHGDPRTQAWQDQSLVEVKAAGNVSASVNKAAAGPMQGLINSVQALGVEISKISGHVSALGVEGPLSEKHFGNELSVTVTNTEDIGKVTSEAVKMGLNVTQVSGNQVTMQDTGLQAPGARAASDAELKAQQQITAELQKQREAQQRSIEATQTRVQNLNNELQGQQMKLAGKEREHAVEQAILAAKKENPNITAQELEMIRQKADLQYQLSQVQKLEPEQKKIIVPILEQINALEAQRNALIAARQAAEASGDSSELARVNADLANVEAKLQQARAQADNFWNAVGGAAADTGIQKMKNLKDATKAAGDQAQQSAGNFAQMFADGVVNAFDQMAQAIANGEDAMKALGNAFRKMAADFLMQIAKMIIQQTILNALQGSGGGGLFGGGGFMSMFRLFHQGGIVGSAGPSRLASPAWFQNALRYHSGGIAGLKPGEVPAILQRGEEILNEDNPRHIANGGGSGAMPNMRIINAFDGASFLSEGLNSKPGEQAMFNFVKANAGSIKNLLK